MGHQPVDRVWCQWQPWFAWYPVKVHTQWTWLNPIYRRYSYLYGLARSGHYEYGNIFDVLEAK